MNESLKLEELDKYYSKIPIEDIQLSIQDLADMSHKTVIPLLEDGEQKTRILSNIEKDRETDAKVRKLLGMPRDDLLPSYNPGKHFDDGTVESIRQYKHPFATASQRPYTEEGELIIETIMYHHDRLSDG